MADDSPFVPDLVSERLDKICPSCGESSKKTLLDAVPSGGTTEGAARPTQSGGRQLSLFDDQFVSSSGKVYLKI